GLAGERGIRTERGTLALGDVEERVAAGTDGVHPGLPGRVDERGLEGLLDRAYGTRVERQVVVRETQRCGPGWNHERAFQGDLEGIALAEDDTVVYARCVESDRAFSSICAPGLVGRPPGQSVGEAAAIEVEGRTGQVGERVHQLVDGPVENGVRTVGRTVERQLRGERVVSLGVEGDVEIGPAVDPGLELLDAGDRVGDHARDRGVGIGSPRGAWE